MPRKFGKKPRKFRAKAHKRSYGSVYRVRPLARRRRVRVIVRRASDLRERRDIRTDEEMKELRHGPHEVAEDRSLVIVTAETEEERGLFETILAASGRFVRAIIKVISDAIRSFVEAISRKRKETTETEKQLEETDKEQTQEQIRKIELYIDDIDDILRQTLTDKELEMLVSLIVEAMKTYRSEIPLHWLPEEKRAIVKAWLATNWGLYSNLGWHAVALTQSIAHKIAKLYPKMPFRIYIQICWRDIDAPDMYRGKTTTKIICITPYVATINGEDLPSLLDPATLSSLIQNAPSYSNWGDYLDVAEFTRVWIKPEGD